MDKKIHIIGSGISGLVAALVLESKGFSPVILESSGRAGGRIKTDFIDGYQLDRGFQVLLSSYPAAKKYLDYKALNLQIFKPGAVIFEEGKQKLIGDPLRNPSALWATLFSGIGTLGDKLKILKLNKYLEQKSNDEIFKSKEITTKEYLEDFGFSSSFIETFFRPFFTGIFLETELATSSRMFEFVFKQFGSGYAVLPSGGIEEISKQLVSKLKRTTFRFHTIVEEVNDNEISLKDGSKIATDYTIIATEASNVLSNIKSKKQGWKSCQNLYFKAPKRNIDKPYIGLVSNKELLVNNIFYHTSLQMDHKGNQDLLSVTVVKKHQLSDSELIDQVILELKKECKIDQLQFLKLYHIPKALPNLSDLKYQPSNVDIEYSETIFLASDTLLNGSSNAAMIAGESAALRLLEKIE